MTDSERPVFAEPLFILAMDHRDSLAKKVYGIDGDPDQDQVEAIRRGKELVYGGLQQAIQSGSDIRHNAVLVDERYGAEVARQAKAAGVVLAMPIERSGQDWFALEYGTLDSEAWLDHLSEFDPAFAKVLVRDNPAFDVERRQKQLHDLGVVSAKLVAAGRSLLIELLVPPTQNEKGDRYDADRRPELTEELITEYQSAGIEPAIWKIEGLDSRKSAERVVAVTQQGGRGTVRCIVLGRDAPPDQLDHWLETGAPVPGFAGFAIGRSIWQQPLIDHLAGQTSESDAVGRIAANYRHYVDTYTAAASKP